MIPRRKFALASSLILGSLIGFYLTARRPIPPPGMNAMRPARPAYLPNPIITPGAVRPVAPGELCTPGAATAARRVTTAMRDQTFRAYGIPADRHGDFVIDHLIPLACGGANSSGNRWPQPKVGPYTDRMKDRLEGRMNRLICSGKITPEAAQNAFRGDWTAEYRNQGLDKLRVTPDEPDTDDEGFPR